MKYTLFLILIAVLAFFLPAFFVHDVDTFYNTYGFSYENLLARPYVLITSIFLHAGVLHLLSNILVWFFFGAAVEKELGWKKMIIIFLVGAFAGDLFSLFFYPAGIVSIGASAGIFALVGAGMLVAPLDLSFYPLIIPMPLAFLGVLYAIYNAYAFVA
ncbi:MAG: rhomboid family intramembrane serine protease, partial [Candidatus Aenigmarchaeota archaeon]|nr:rhomboid family intramembrane serine protease [Candidatus Aenigmarchaeota archaeon]